MIAHLFSLDHPVVFDGAMGTMLHSMGLSPGECPEYWNISKPEVVIGVLKAFVDSGAEVIQTNSFGANRIKLAKFGLEDKVAEINKSAVANAKRAAGSRTKVAISVGPTGNILEPWGTLSFDNAVDVFREQIESAISGNPDLIIIETMTQLSEARAALYAAKTLTSIPIITTMAFDTHCRTVFGTSPEAAAITLDAMGAEMVGVNCVGDFYVLSNIVHRMSKAIGKSVIAQPNAGNPKTSDGKTIFPLTPEVFAQGSSKLLRAGAGFVGGCCGTTPNHIKALANEAKSKVFPKVAKNPLDATASNFDATFFKFQEVFTLIGKADPNRMTQREMPSGSCSRLIKGAKLQWNNGAKIIGIDVGALDDEDPNLVKEAVLSFQKNLRWGVCFEGSNEEAIETALKNFHGRAVLRLSKANQEKHNNLMSIAEKYGALVVE